MQRPLRQHVVKLFPSNKDVSALLGSMSSRVPTESLFEMLNVLYTAFDSLVDKHGVYKVDTIGDGEIVTLSKGCRCYFYQQSPTHTFGHNDGSWIGISKGCRCFSCGSQQPKT